MAITGSVDIGDGLLVLTVDHDPTVVATDAPLGSVIINSSGEWYRKLDAGSSTNIVEMSPHNSTHVDGGPDEIDGDTVDIDYTPTNYIPSLTGAPEANDLDDLAAHLNGIDQGLVTIPGAGNNFVFAYDTTTQLAAVVNTYQNISFDTTANIDGWTHTLGTDFTCNLTGGYLVIVTGNMEKAGGSSPTGAIRITLDGTEIPGSHFGMDLTSNNTAFVVTKNIFAAVTTGQVLRVQFAGSTTTVSVTPGPNPGTAATTPSITLTIRRIA
jgi:hypothetical protein